MPRYVNNPLIAKVHVIDANGDPVTGATVSVKVLDPAGQDWDGTWNADYYSDGVYYTEITPDSVGDWTFIFTCSNPKFSKATVYHVSPMDIFIEQNRIYRELVPPVEDQWYTVCDLEGMLRVYKVSFGQTNDETAMKNVTVRVTVDDGSPSEVGRDATSGDWNSIIREGDGSFAVDTTDEGLLGFYSFAGVLPTPKNFPLECNKLKVEMRMNSAPGTNEYFDCGVQFAAKGEYLDHND